MVESEIVRGGGEIEGENDPWNAGKVIATVVNGCRHLDFDIPPSWRAIVGRHAKTLLEEGWPGDLVSAAAMMAVLRGRPEIVQHVAGDLILAEKGLRMNRAEYEQKLALFAAQRNGVTAMLADHKAQVANRREEVERRRSGRK